MARHRGRSTISKAPAETRPVMVYRPIQPGASSLKHRELCQSPLLRPFPARGEGMERSPVDSSHFRHCLRSAAEKKSRWTAWRKGMRHERRRMCGPFVMACAAERGCYIASGDEKTAASQGGRSAICWRDTASTMAPPSGGAGRDCEGHLLRTRLGMIVI